MPTTEHSAIDPPADRPQLAESLEGRGRVMFLGQGADVYKGDIVEVLSGEALFGPPHLMVPSPAAVAALGLRILEEGQLPDPITLVPEYCRKSEAELKAK